jgi:hypothetical protein
MTSDHDPDTLVAAYRQGYREASGQETDQDEQTILETLDASNVTGLQGAHMRGREAALTEQGDDMATNPTPPKQPNPNPTPQPTPKPGDKGGDRR